MLEILIVLVCLITVRPDPLPYAEWAHYHMVWLSDSHSNQKDIRRVRQAAMTGFDCCLHSDLQMA
jgi:hypothetical protein